MQIIRSPKVYDVCIVGSGAGGGTAAKVLTEAGADVAMLEGGPMWDSSKDGAMMTWNYQSLARGWGGDKKPFGLYDGCIGGWDMEGEPYTVGVGAWRWFRGRMLGGRTHHWGRISLRFGPDDFRRRSLDGQGEDWPFTYDEIKPYYDKLDAFVGIFGTNHASTTGLHNEPDGIFQPPPKARAHELLIKQACDRLKIPVVAARKSILTRTLNNRPPCHYCGQCGRGCATHSNFSSVSVMLPPALATGKLTIIPNAMAREVMTNGDGLATGISYVNTEQLTEHQVRARIVVLAASCCESARLLLNSKSSQFPDGLANSSGVVGKYLTDSTGLAVSGFIPALQDTPRYNSDGVGGMHIYVPWWGNNKALGFPRGYHVELGAASGCLATASAPESRIFRRPVVVATVPTSRTNTALLRLVRELRRTRRADRARGLLLRDRSQRGRQVGHSGAALPSHVERSRAAPGQAHAGDVQEHHRGNGRRADGTMPGREQDYGLEAGGVIIHEAGATRMGTSPRRQCSTATPGARREESVRRRWRPLPLPRQTRTSRGPSWRWPGGHRSTSLPPAIGETCS